MSRFYSYDVFLSCAYEDEDAARLLRNKLLELGFHSWFEIPQMEEKGVFIEEMWKAIEDSAVCVLLVGSGGKFPWVDSSVGSAINCRLERPQNPFRVVTVFLPQASSGSAGTLVRFNAAQFVNRHCQSPIVRFKESLDEEEVLRELVLGIRGAIPHGQSYFSNGLFREQIYLRAQNALNVDWHKLVSEACSTSFDSSNQHCEVSRRSGEVNTGVEADWCYPVLKRHGATRRFRRYPSSINLLQSDLREVIALPEISPENSADQTEPEAFSTQHLAGLINALNSNSRAAMAAALLLLTFSVLGYWSWNHFPNKEIALEGGSYNKVDDRLIAAAVESKPDDDISFKAGERRKPPKKATVRQRVSENSPAGRNQVAEVVDFVDHASYRPTGSLARQGRTRFGYHIISKTKKNSNGKPLGDILLSSDDIGSDPIAQDLAADTPLKSSRQDRLRMLDLSEFRGPLEVEVSQWEKSYKIKLARMKRIYVEVSDNTGLDETSKALLVARFIRPLKEKGIEAFTNEGDKYRADGIASLKFGAQEMRSGLVSVELRDNNNQNMNSWVTPTVCNLPDKEELRTVLCNASQQLGVKLVSAIRDVDKQAPDSGTSGEVRSLRLR